MGNCELEYQLPFVYDLDKSNGYFMLSIELKAILAKKKLQIAVVLNDVFKTGASNNYTFFDNIKINRQYYNDSRQLKVALSYLAIKSVRKD